MNYTLNVPINSVSFGQCSFAILREFYKKNIQPCIFPIGQVDGSSQKIDPDFGNWINSCINKSMSIHNRRNPTFKLWHINGSLESLGEKQTLFTFYELDNPTEQEVNILNNQDKVIVSSDYSKRIFEENGVKNVNYIPLGFDSYNFNKKEKKYFNDNRVVFNVLGKYEPVRKRHEKVIKSWIKKYGNNPEFFLQCAIYNPFFSQQENEEIVRNLLENKNYFNVQFLGFMPQNELYNDFLNSGSIVIDMGTEGWSLGSFHSVAIGKHAVLLDCAGIKGWATNDNSVLVKPFSKIPAYDGKFFFQGSPFNQGNVFDFKEEEFLSSCDKCINLFRKNPVNLKGLELQEKFTFTKTVDSILNLMNN